MTTVQTRFGRWKLVIVALSVCLLPVLLIVVGIFLKESRGAYWIGSNYDPDYPYLLNGLNIVTHQPIGHYDHPGTPVQSFNAMVIAVTHLIRSNQQSDVATDVLQHPELYLQVISYTFLVINALLLFAIGLTSYSVFKNIWLGFLLQSSPFFAGVVLMTGLTKVAPEAMLVTVSLLLLWLLALTLGRIPKQRWGSLWLAVGFAVVIGLGIATKINFFPVFLLPFFVIKTIRLKVVYTVGVGLAFILFTLPIAAHYQVLFSWIVGLLFHTGIHGGGDSGIITWPTFISNLKILFGAFPYITDSLVVVGLFMIINLVLPQRRAYLQSQTFRICLAAAITQLAGFVLVAKHMSPHYFLPFVSLTAVMMAMVFLQLREWQQIKTLGGLFVGTLLILLAVKSFYFTYVTTREANNIEIATRQEVLALNQELEQHYMGYKIFHYFRSSTPAFALKFGNNFASSAYTTQLQAAYPNFYFYEISNNHFSSWNTGIDITVLRQQDPNLILTGSPFETTYINDPSYRPQLPLVDQWHGQAETFYTISQ